MWLLRISANVLWNFQGHRNIMVYVLSKISCTAFHKIRKFTVMFRIKIEGVKIKGDIAKLRTIKNSEQKAEINSQVLINQKNTNGRGTWILEKQLLDNELIVIKTNSIVIKNKLYHNECTSSKTLVIDNPHSELLPNFDKIVI